MLYEDIENLEYREQVAYGNRENGYGVQGLTMGECEGSEFGNYTGYFYPKCKAAVVLTVNGHILVVNGEDEEDTKAIYE